MIKILLIVLLLAGCTTQDIIIGDATNTSRIQFNTSIEFSNSTKAPDPFQIQMWVLGCESCSRSEFFTFKEEVLEQIIPNEVTFDSYSIKEDTEQYAFESLNSDHTLTGFYFNVTYEGFKTKISHPKIETQYFAQLIEEPLNALDAQDLYACEIDEDCVQVGTNCCSQANCGFTAINEKYYDEWFSKFSCQGVSCAAVLCPVGFNIACEEKQCVLRRYVPE